LRPRPQTPTFRLMRRHDREITDRVAMEDIIRRSTVCHLGMCDGDQPYIVPVNFGYRDRTVFVHCAPEGKKIEILRCNPRVCIEFDVDDEIVPGGRAADCTSKYRSVLAYGRASFVTEPAAKRAALDILMAQYTEGDHEYKDEIVARTLIIRIDIDEMTGKQNGFKED